MKMAASRNCASPILLLSFTSKPAAAALSVPNTLMARGSIETALHSALLRDQLHKHLCHLRGHTLILMLEKNEDITPILFLYQLYPLF